MAAEIVERLDRVQEQTERAGIRFATGAEVTESLKSALVDSNRLTFRGGTGTYTRVETLPKLIGHARGRRDLTVRLEILSPDHAACNRYAELYKSLADEGDDAQTWTAKGTQIEVFATILAVCWYKQRSGHLLDIELALTSRESMFRFDLTSEYLIVTQRGPRYPAMIVKKGLPEYDSWSIELRTSFNASERVPLERASAVALSREPTVPEVRALFEILGLDLPADFDETDVRTIISKALKRESNPNPAGLGD
ncbi:hypothetical protein [Nocardia sp. NPDC127526]|uniref:hypothetical protein n=1 Tax=Nocardia sp. NPDC127526 TaxID=3345393 RepID=UPI0036302DA8